MVQPKMSTPFTEELLVKHFLIQDQNIDTKHPLVSLTCSIVNMTVTKLTYKYTDVNSKLNASKSKSVGVLKTVDCLKTEDAL